MKQTIRSQCPICGATLEPVKILYGVKAMMVCRGCTTMVEVEVEELQHSSTESEESE